MEYAPDPYTRRPEDAREPPQGFAPTLKFLGPSLILAGSVVGSGEIILTTTLGAAIDGVDPDLRSGRCRHRT